MRIIKQSWSFEQIQNGYQILQQIERAGRTCYKSEGSTTQDSAPSFVKSILNRGHESVIEHVSVSVRIITDRGVTHEIVRHRLASYSQESTRYNNYSKNKYNNGITVILPIWFYNTKNNLDEYKIWYTAMSASEEAYLSLIQSNQTPQQARSVLPNSLKTEMVMTANLREWRHFFTLRTAPNAHPQMHDLACSMLLGFQEAVPVIFDDIIPG